MFDLHAMADELAKIAETAVSAKIINEDLPSAGLDGTPKEQDRAVTRVPGVTEQTRYNGVHDQISKLAAVSAEEAQRSLGHLQKLEENKPGVGELGRGAAIGAVINPALTAVTRAIAGSKTPYGIRGIAADVVKGGVGGGLVPFIRHSADYGAEKSKLKKFMKENPQ